MTPITFIVTSVCKSIFFFFFISNKDAYSRTLPYAESHKAEKKLQREDKRERERRKRY